MTDTDKPAPHQRAPWAKKRILETATRLFYAEGIRFVGVDQLIRESQVTKATFYKHYRSKDNLIVAYVTEEHLREKASIERLVRESSGARESLNAIVAVLIEQLRSPGFRGCPFTNAAVEQPDPTHPLRQLVSGHRDWYSTTIEKLLAAAGHPFPGEGADDFMLARDGALCGGYAGDPVAAVGALRRAVGGILAATGS